MDDAIPTRQSLLERLKNWDDQQSWEEFFNAYWRLIYSVALQAGLTEVEAQDVVQETIMAVARNIKDFKTGRQHGSFKAWLLHITRWRITDQLRKRLPIALSSRHRADETARTSTVERIPDPASLDFEAVWEQQWEQNLADIALRKVKARVNPESYLMFDLHVNQRWPARKVAAKLGASLGQVYFAKYKITRLIEKEARKLRDRPV